jgi:predicted nucleic acid-binding protein
MSVVSNSSPLWYLIIIDQIRLMQMMFEEVLVPEAVVCELADEGAPSDVRKCIARPPGWLRVQRVMGESLPQLGRLHVGERDAILLAHQVNADLVVIVERAARRIARGQGLNVIGLIGILDESATRGLVDLLTAVERLRKPAFVHPLTFSRCSLRLEPKGSFPSSP